MVLGRRYEARERVIGGGRSGGDEGREIRGRRGCSDEVPSRPVEATGVDGVPKRCELPAGNRGRIVRHPGGRGALGDESVVASTAQNVSIHTNVDTDISGIRVGRMDMKPAH